MPRNLKRYQNSRQLHFITFSCYHRRPLLRKPSRRQIFLRCLEAARRRFDFVVVGYVVMPEHVHLLVSEPEHGTLAAAVQVLKQNSSRLSRKSRNPAQQELFQPPQLLPAFWQTRYYDFNVRTGRKRIEKLNYMHNNPVKRGLCSAPEEWKWSSYRSYVADEPGIVRINQFQNIAALQEL